MADAQKHDTTLDKGTLGILADDGPSKRAAIARDDARDGEAITAGMGGAKTGAAKAERVPQKSYMQLEAERAARAQEIEDDGGNVAEIMAREQKGESK